MDIHKTFSKKDIIEICDILNIDIEDISDLNKAQLIKALDKWMTTTLSTEYTSFRQLIRVNHTFKIN